MNKILAGKGTENRRKPSVRRFSITFDRSDAAMTAAMALEWMIDKSSRNRGAPHLNQIILYRMIAIFYISAPINQSVMELVD